MQNLKLNPKSESMYFVKKYYKELSNYNLHRWSANEGQIKFWVEAPRRREHIGDLFIYDMTILK